jgi:hypothetical protein
VSRDEDRRRAALLVPESATGHEVDLVAHALREERERLLAAIEALAGWRVRRFFCEGSRAIHYLDREDVLALLRGGS